MEFSILVAIIFISIILFIKHKRPIWIGRAGERFISRKLRELDPVHYRILNDLMLPSQGRSSATQIDHVVVSNYGIFCIETKAYRGWIFGNAKQEYWTQIIYRYRKKFYNPLWQNFAHIKAIESLITLNKIKEPIVSFVAIPDADKIKVFGTYSVGYGRDIVRKIQSYSRVIYSDAERDEIYDALNEANILDKKARKYHNREVRQLK